MHEYMMSDPMVRAPDFPPGLEWLNSDRPVSLKELRGKVVLLDFWTYCGINCMHVLPELDALEKAFPVELVIIGIHSAKFPNEREAGNVRQAILRHGLAHPVVNDDQFLIWRSYTVRAWPTLVLIDPQGYIVATLAGEGHGNHLRQMIVTLIQEHRKKGTLKEDPVRFHRDQMPEP